MLNNGNLAPVESYALKIKSFLLHEAGTLLTVMLDNFRFDALPGDPSSERAFELSNFMPKDVLPEHAGD